MKLSEKVWTAKTTSIKNWTFKGVTKFPSYVILSYITIPRNVIINPCKETPNKITSRMASKSTHTHTHTHTHTRARARVCVCVRVRVCVCVCVCVCVSKTRVFTGNLQPSQPVSSFLGNVSQTEGQHWLAIPRVMGGHAPPHPERLHLPEIALFCMQTHSVVTHHYCVAVKFLTG